MSPPDEREKYKHNTFFDKSGMFNGSILEEWWVNAKDKKDEAVEAATDKVKDTVSSAVESTKDAAFEAVGLKPPPSSSGDDNSETKEDDEWSLMNAFKDMMPSTKDLFQANNILPFIVALAGGSLAKKATGFFGFGSIKSIGIAIVAAIGIFKGAQGWLPKIFNPEAAPEPSPEITLKTENTSDTQEEFNTIVTEKPQIPDNLRKQIDTKIATEERLDVAIKEEPKPEELELHNE